MDNPNHQKSKLQKIPLDGKLLVALSGKIASGKSLVLQIFAAAGFHIISADEIKKTVVNDPQTLQELYDLGLANADKISSLSTDQLQKLEQILLPKIVKMREELIQKHFATSNRTIIYEIPLLHEKQQEDRFDLIINLICDKEVRRSRALERPGMTEEKFNLLDSKQAADGDRIAKSDFVIDTNIPLKELQSQVNKLIEQNENQ